MIFRAGNRFDKDNYFLTEIDTSVPTCEVTGELNGVPVDWEVGGGGSSEFSGATVTFINASPDTVYDIYVLALHNDDNLAVQDLPVTPEEPITLIIPLYKGSTKLPPEPTIKNITEIPTLTGEISLDSESGLIVITGDGTITAKGTPIGD